MPGKHILEGVIILHETIHEIHGKELDGVLFKIDFEKRMIRLNGLSFNKPCVWRDLTQFGVSG
jgi:hypothetical protein